MYAPEARWPMSTRTDPSASAFAETVFLPSTENTASLLARCQAVGIERSGIHGERH